MWRLFEKLPSKLQSWKYQDFHADKLKHIFHLEMNCLVIMSCEIDHETCTIKLMTSLKYCLINAEPANKLHIALLKTSFI